MSEAPESRTCEGCGAKLEANKPESLCTKCLLKAGLEDSERIRSLRIRCPHCHQPVEVLADDPLVEVDCPSCGSHFNLANSETTTIRPHKNQTVAHFELLDHLGTGHFGSVWKAHDSELDRTVAIKLPRQTQIDDLHVEQFLREARAAAQLNHPNIVSVHEVGRENGQIYIVSDLVQGVTLADWLTAERPTPNEAAELCAKIAVALHHAHESGVIHRDLKPSNIMLDADGEPHIMDFGLAKREAGEITMTIEGKVLGTPAYMSPEQAKGEAHKADRRSDVYSLGVILFQLLTGELPFRGSQRMLLHQVINDEAPSPRKLNNQVPKDLETICLKCVEKQANKRYEDASEVASELRRFLEQKPITARPITKSEKLLRWCQREPRIAGLIALSVVLFVTGTAISSIFGILASNRAKTETTQRKIAEEAAVLAEARRLASLLDAVDENQVRYLLACKSVNEFVRNDLTPSDDIAALFQKEVIANGWPFDQAADFVKPFFSKNGQYLVAAVADSESGNKLKRWNLNDGFGANQEVLNEVFPALYNNRFARSDQWLITHDVASKIVSIWDLNALDQRPVHEINHDGPISDIEVSADERWLSIAYDATVSVIDLANTAKIKEREIEIGREVQSVAFTTNSDRLIVLDNSGVIRIWKISHLDEQLIQITHVLESGDQVRTNFRFYVEVSNDGKWLASESYSSTDSRAQIWNLEQANTSLPSFELPFINVMFSPDSQWVALASSKINPKTVGMLWNLKGNQPGTPILLPGLVDQDMEQQGIDFRFSEDGKILATIDYSTSTTKLWKFEQGNWTVTTESNAKISDDPWGRPDVFSTNGKWAVLGDQLWRLSPTKAHIGEIEMVSGMGEVGAEISPDEKWLVGYTGAIPHAKIWNLEFVEQFYTFMSQRSKLGDQERLSCWRSLLSTATAIAGRELSEQERKRFRIGEFKN